MNRIREMRLQKKMNQSELAAMINCTTATVSKYELEQRVIDAPTICALCDIFGCTADYLLGRSSVPSADLSPTEETFIRALRRADDRALDMVALALAPFREEASRSGTE